MHNNLCHTYHQRVIKPITTPTSYKLTKVVIMKVLIILNTSNYTNTISLLTRYKQYTWLNSNAQYIANIKCLIVIRYIYTACTCLAKWLWTPHIQHTPSLNCYRLVDATEHQNDQTQEQFLSPSNPSHEHLTLNVEHNILYINYSPHILIFSFQMCTCQTSHIIVCIVYCASAILYIACLYIVLLLSVSCPVAVILSL